MQGMACLQADDSYTLQAKTSSLRQHYWIFLQTAAPTQQPSARYCLLTNYLSSASLVS